MSSLDAGYNEAVESQRMLDGYYAARDELEDALDDL